MIVGKPETGRKAVGSEVECDYWSSRLWKLIGQGKNSLPLNWYTVSCLNMYEFGYFERFFSQLILVLSQKSKAMAKSQTLHEANWAGRIKFIKSSTQSVSS